MSKDICKPLKLKQTNTPREKFANSSRRYEPGLHKRKNRGEKMDKGVYFFYLIRSPLRNKQQITCGVEMEIRNIE